jgi:hypothetical protein
MTDVKKSAALHSQNENRRATQEKRSDAADGTERRLAVRKILAGRDIDPEAARIIEDTAVKYAPALKHLADR